jgi:hypothetical protein
MASRLGVGRFDGDSFQFFEFQEPWNFERSPALAGDFFARLPGFDRNFSAALTRYEILLSHANFSLDGKLLVYPDEKILGS